MGGGGKNAAKREAQRARADEEARQARIRTGTAAINRTFDGGRVGTGALGSDAVYDPTKKYYRADGTEWRPRSSGFGGFGGGSQPPQSGTPAGGMPSLVDRLTGGTTQAQPQVGRPASGPGGIFGMPSLNGAFGGADREWQRALKDGLFSGVEEREGFGDKFFGGIRDSFVNFARPQVDDQFRKASEQGTFQLARSGTLDSSIRGDQTADLKKQYDISLQDITDKARGYETEARNNVERTRGDLISMLQVTGDATGAANSALTRAATLATPPAYSPLGQLFQDGTAMLGQQMAAERAFALGLGPKPRGGAGLFAPAGGGSVKVT